MKLLNFGSCLSFSVTCRIDKYHHGQAQELLKINRLGCVRFNRIDRFVNTYIHRSVPEVPITYLQQLDLDWPEILPAEPKGALGQIYNQLSDYHLGTGFSKRLSTPLLEGLEQECPDVVIYDDFFDVKQKVLYPTASEYRESSIFFNTKLVPDYKRYFTFDEQYLDVKAVVQGYRDLTAFLRKRNPAVKIFFIGYSHLHHRSPLIRHRQVQLQAAARQALMDVFYIPPVPIPEQFRKPGDPIHWRAWGDRNLNDDYAWIVDRIITENWTPRDWTIYLEQVGTENLLDTAYRDRTADPAIGSAIRTSSTDISTGALPMPTSSERAPTADRTSTPPHSPSLSSVAPEPMWPQ